MQIVILGNSLTYANDLPGMIIELAMAGGAPRPLITSEAQPDYSLEDHWHRPSSVASVDRPELDLVIMQQGPSSVAESGLHLTHWSAMFANRAAQHQTRSGLYMVWPPVGGNIDGSIANYAAAAYTNGLALYPVAHAIKSISITHPHISVLAGDGFHPNIAGTWLAAMVITAVVYDQDPRTYPNIRSGVIPAGWEEPLRNAAWEAVQAMGRR